MEGMKTLWTAGWAALALGTGIAQSQVEPVEVEGRWSVERVQAWYAELPWLVGCNYYPATAINAIEMWQASTFDPDRIAKELDWAAELGMNTQRVYLHDLVWADDAEGLYGRMDTFLALCAERGIRPFFVFFDDCHYLEPKLGPQPLPVKRWHNSGWVNSPARELAKRYAKRERGGQFTARDEGAEGRGDQLGFRVGKEGNHLALGKPGAAGCGWEKTDRRQPARKG